MAAEGPWAWRYVGPATSEAEPAADAPPDFPTQADAESWLGEEWRRLLEEGIEAVDLYEADRHVYGPMSLRPTP